MPTELTVEYFRLAMFGIDVATNADVTGDRVSTQRIRQA